MSAISAVQVRVDGRALGPGSGRLLAVRVVSRLGQPTQCELTFGTVKVLVGGDLTAAERDQVVAGLHLATFADPRTWFDVVGAIPGA